jgi:hypothetical protein
MSWGKIKQLEFMQKTDSEKGDKQQQNQGHASSNQLCSLLVRENVRYVGRRSESKRYIYVLPNQEDKQTPLSACNSCCSSH